MPEFNIGGPVQVINTPNVIDVTPAFAVGHTTHGAAIVVVPIGTSWTSVLATDNTRKKVYLFNTGTVDLYVLPWDSISANTSGTSGGPVPPAGIHLPTRGGNGPASTWHESYYGALCAICATGAGSAGQLQVIEF